MGSTHKLKTTYYLECTSRQNPQGLAEDSAEVGSRWSAHRLKRSCEVSVGKAGGELEPTHIYIYM